MSVSMKELLTSPLSPIIERERIYTAKMSFTWNYAKEHTQILSSIVSERLTPRRDMKAGVHTMCVFVDLESRMATV